MIQALSIRHRRWWLGVAVGLGLAAAGCACSRKAEPVHSEARKPDANTPWVVRIGSRGGFTGGSSGNVIRSDGDVSSFSQMTPDDSLEVEPVGRATPETLQALRDAMLAPDLMSLAHLERGNMTDFLEWVQGGDLRSYTWIERMRGTPLPEPLKRAHDAAMAAVNSAHP
jgi:hypothetical protein